MLTNRADCAETQNTWKRALPWPRTSESALWLCDWAVTRRQDRATPTICPVSPTAWPKQDDLAQRGHRWRGQSGNGGNTLSVGLERFTHAFRHGDKVFENENCSAT
jgi:hypothetical protein